jgi:hypothetical protein
VVNESRVGEIATCEICGQESKVLDFEARPGAETDPKQVTGASNFPYVELCGNLFLAAAIAAKSLFIALFGCVFIAKAALAMVRIRRSNA